MTSFDVPPDLPTAEPGSIGTRTRTSGRVRRSVLVAHPSSELYGSDRVLLESVSALVEDGTDVIVTVPEEGPLLHQLRQRGARVFICPTPVLRKSALRPAGMLRLMRDAASGLVHGARLIRSENPEALYVNTLTIPLWLVLARLGRVPSLCHVHEGESSASAVLRACLTLPLHLADQVVANSEFSVNVLRRSSRRLARRTQVIYNGVPGPPERQKARASLSGTVHVAYVGRLSPRKGVDVAVAALALLRNRGVEAHLDLIGAVFPGYEWYEAQLREQVASAGLVDRVRFHGFQPNVWDAVGAADVVVVPSRVDEPFGNTAVEAVLSARPVIASATSGLLEATAGYDSATVIDAADPVALADALQQLIATWDTARESAWHDTALAEARHGPPVYRAQIAHAIRTLGE